MATLKIIKFKLMHLNFNGKLAFDEIDEMDEMIEMETQTFIMLIIGLNLNSIKLINQFLYNLLNCADKLLADSIT